MRICASIAIRSIRSARRLEPVLRLLENTPLEINITGIVRGADFESFIPLLAVELEDLVNVEQVQYVRTSTRPERGLVERLLSLLDYLNVERLVLSAPEDLDSDLMMDVVDEASRYGIRVIWRLPSAVTVDELNRLADELAPYRLRIAMDVASRRSVREFARSFIEASGYIYVMYLDNKSRRERGLPIFCEKGKINYVKIAKILTCVRYEGDVVLRYRPEYYGHYRGDIDLLSMILSSIGSRVVDEKTKRLVESILRDIAGWSQEDLSYLYSG